METVTKHEWIGEYGTYGNQHVIRCGQEVIAQLGNGGLREKHDLSQDAKLVARRDFIVRACNSHDELVEALKDAKLRLQEFIGADCECDNTHETNETICCLCEYAAAIAKAE